MNPADTIDFARSAILVLLEIIAPTMLTALVVGLAIGLLQALTQIQEQTLPFGIKLIAVIFCLYLLAGWSGERLMNFSIEMLEVATRVQA